MWCIGHPNGSFEVFVVFPESCEIAHCHDASEEKDDEIDVDGGLFYPVFEFVEKDGLEHVFEFSN